MRIALITLLLFGCAGSPEAVDAHERAEAARKQLNQIGEQGDRAFVAASYACTAFAPADPKLQTLCGKLLPAQRVFRDAWVASWSAIDLYQAGLMTREDLLDAIESVSGFVGMWRDTERLVRDAETVLVGSPGSAPQRDDRHAPVAPEAADATTSADDAGAGEGAPGQAGVEQGAPGSGAGP